MTKSTFDKIVRVCWRCMKYSNGGNESGLCLECRRTTQQMRDHHPYVLAVFNLSKSELYVSTYDSLKEVM